MYAVIEDSGRQFRVCEGDVVDVDLRELGEDAVEIEFDRVLLIGGGEQVSVGMPLVEGAKVVGEVLARQVKGPKLHVYRFRRRKNSQRKMGHRQKFVQVRITKIVA